MLLVIPLRMCFLLDGFRRSMIDLNVICMVQSLQVGISNVIRHADGNLVYAFTKTLAGCFSPSEVEALAYVKLSTRFSKCS